MGTQDRFRPRNGSFFAKGHNDNGTKDLRTFLEEKEMTYEVRKEPIYVPAFQTDDPEEGIYGEEIEAPQFVRVPNQWNIRRMSDGKIVSPASVSDQYGEMGPLDMLEQLSGFCEHGWAMPDSAFLLDNDRVECIALRLQQVDDIGKDLLDGDVINWYLVARNAHGRESARASVFGERVISQSGITALEKASGFELVHRGKVRRKYKKHFQRWEELRAIIGKMTQTLGGYYSVKMSSARAEEIINALLDIKKVGNTLLEKKGTNKGSEISTQKKNLRMAYLDAFCMPRFGTFGQTAADLYHGVCWVGSHYTPERTTLTTEDLTERLLTGVTGQRERKALGLIDRYIANL